MDLSYDPVAGDLTVAGPGGQPAFHAPAAYVFLKQYRDDGFLFCQLQGESALLAFRDLDDAPRPLALEPAEGGWWRVLTP